MNPINNVAVGWKDLEGVLNRLVKAINRRTIETGFGLTKEEGENGVIIALESGKTGSGDPGSTPAPPDADETTPDEEKAAWHQIFVQQGDCKILTMYVWGGSPGGNPKKGGNSGPTTPMSGT